MMRTSFFVIFTSSFSSLSVILKNRDYRVSQYLFFVCLSKCLVKAEPTQIVVYMFSFYLYILMGGGMRRTWCVCEGGEGWRTSQSSFLTESKFLDHRRRVKRMLGSHAFRGRRSPPWGTNKSSQWKMNELLWLILSIWWYISVIWGESTIFQVTLWGIVGWSRWVYLELYKVAGASSGSKLIHFQCLSTTHYTDDPNKCLRKVVKASKIFTLRLSTGNCVIFYCHDSPPSGRSIAVSSIKVD